MILIEVDGEVTLTFNVIQVVGQLEQFIWNLRIGTINYVSTLVKSVVRNGLSLTGVL